MSRRNKIIASLVFLALSIVLIVCGIALFNLVPNVDVSLLTTKESAYMAGSIFVFIFALCALGGGIAFFISALEREYY